MKTVFITGASSGIGRETTKYFATQGWRVIATMRNLKKAGDLETLPNVIVMPLDVTDTEQIRQTCRKALAQYDIDVLLNNAGYQKRAVKAPCFSYGDETAQIILFIF